MNAPLDVPHTADLAALPVEVAVSAAPGVVSVTALANDGAVVTLTWDEIAASVSIRWAEGEAERLVLERESASKVSVRDERGAIEFHIWSEVEGLAGQLVVRVGDHVHVADTILRS